MSGALALAVAATLIVLSAFFVAVEFALVTARRHRLEDAAANSAAARAALRASRELSLVLAGSQLGITLCTLGLGAVAKPAVHDLLTPLLASWGLPEATADVAAFVLALAVVTLLHLVVGEMAPKSWAIAHPERAAIWLALPMGAFMRATRPLLTLMNDLANRCLRLVGVAPVEEMAAGHNPATLRELVDHSAAAGALDTERRDRMVAAMDLEQATLASVTRPLASVSGVRATDPVAVVRDVARDTGHLRLVVWPADRSGDPVGMVHVRDTLTADPATTAGDVMRPLLTLAAGTPVYAALATLRARHSQFAMVRDGAEPLGLVTMQDLLDRLLPVG
ncbi:hemolysin family protein [Pseudonocardia eucalypti]|uniref:Hemolysin family protein n=1 Tax=Pseudonocardia eucalypti TaxID=648755 RepID=A0ABP9QEJ9_9PSEU|nr:CBS domain containing-hemolysin-like protein [Pseudonocardia eucalypti]